MAAEVMRDLVEEITRLNQTIKDVKSVQLTQHKPNAFAHMAIQTHDFRKTSTSTADDSFNGQSETLLYKNKLKQDLILKSIHVNMYNNVFDTTSTAAPQAFDRHVTITHKGVNKNYDLLPRTRFYNLSIGEVDQSGVVVPFMSEYDLDLTLNPQDEIFVKTEFKIGQDSSRRLWQALTVYSGVITEYEPMRG